MDSNDNIEEIEKFLEGKLDGDDLERFQSRLQSDQVLAKKVALMRKVDLSLADENAMDLHSKLTDLGNEFFSSTNGKDAVASPKTKPIKSTFDRRPLTIGIVVLGLLAIILLLWWQLSKAPLSGPELYQNYYAAYLVEDGSRGGDSDYQQGVELYNEQNYSEAINAFEKHLDSIPNDMRAIYTLAHAHLNQTPPEYEQASIQFQKVIADGKSILLTQAKWYQALIYLRKEEWTSAKKYLLEVSKTNNSNLAGQAADLLKKLN